MAAVKRQFAEGTAGKGAHGGGMCVRGRPNWTKVARELGFADPNIAARRCYRRWLAIDPDNKEAYARERERSRARYLRHKQKILLDSKRRRMAPRSDVAGLDDLFTEETIDNDHEIPVTDLADLTEFDVDAFEDLDNFDDLTEATMGALLAENDYVENDLYCTDETMSDIDAADEKLGSITFQTMSHIPRSSYKSVVGTPLTLSYTFQPSNLGVRYKFEQTRLGQRLAELARKDAADAKRFTQSLQLPDESTATPAPAPTLTPSQDWRRIERLLRHPVSHEKVVLSAPAPPRQTASLAPPLTQERMDSYVKICKSLEGMESSAKPPQRVRSDAQRVLHPDFELPQFLLMEA